MPAPTKQAHVTYITISHLDAKLLSMSSVLSKKHYCHLHTDDMQEPVQRYSRVLRLAEAPRELLASVSAVISHETNEMPTLSFRRKKIQQINERTKIDYPSSMERFLQDLTAAWHKAQSSETVARRALFSLSNEVKKRQRFH